MVTSCPSQVAGLVFKAHRLFYHSILALRVIINKEKLQAHSEKLAGRTKRLECLRNREHALHMHHLKFHLC